MEIHPLSRFTKGWFVGHFDPALIDTKDVEVAIKHYQAGAYEARHHHRIATEITAVVSGVVRMNDREVTAGQMVMIQPGTSSDFSAVTDVTTVVVKHPGASDDKYPGAAPGEAS